MKYLFFLLLLLISGCSNKEDITLPVPDDEDINNTEYSPEGDIEKKDDIKVDIDCAESSSYEKTNNMHINKTIDGNLSTIFNSGWDTTVDGYFPITMDYFFKDVDFIDYCIYYPRPASTGTGGNFEAFEVWYMDNDMDEYKKILEMNVRKSSSPSKIVFPERINNPKSIRFKIDGPLGVVCAEMEFYKKGDWLYDPLNVFTDITCTSLKEGITEDDIEKIPNNFYKNLASSIYNKSYPFNERVIECKCFPHPSVVSERLSIGGYSLRDNPTGIYVKNGENLILMLNDTYGSVVQLVVQDLQSGYNTSKTYNLEKGVNKIKIEKEGLLYLMYYSDKWESNLPSIKVNIPTGEVNGVMRLGDDTEKWKDILNNAKAKHLDLVGKHAHMTFPVSSLKQYCKDGSRLIELYDSIAFLEKDFMGVYKYGHEFPNRMYYIVSHKDGDYMYATANRTVYHESTMSNLCDIDKLRSGSWGPAHETGHINQLRPGLNWRGVGEVTNNIHSLYVQELFGETSALISKNRYDEAYDLIMKSQAAYASFPTDHFPRLVPFWQLYLYYTKCLGRDDFYKDLYERIRNEQDKTKTPGQQQLDFVKHACIIAKENLIDFFEKWGFLKECNISVGDGYGDYEFIVEQTDIDAVKNEINVMGLQKNKHALWYVNELNVEIFKNNSRVIKGSGYIKQGELILTDWKNVVAFEIYDDKRKLINISTKENITLPYRCDYYYVRGISSDNNYEEITVKFTNE